VSTSPGRDVYITTSIILTADHPAILGVISDLQRDLLSTSIMMPVFLDGTVLRLAILLPTYQDQADCQVEFLRPNHCHSEVYLLQELALSRAVNPLVVNSHESSTPFHPLWFSPSGLDDSDNLDLHSPVLKL